MCLACPRLLLCSPRFQYTLVLLPLPFRRSSFFSTANLAPPVARYTPVLPSRGPAEDGERNPKDDARTLERLDKLERYRVNSVAS